MSEQATVWTKFKDFLGGTVINSISQIHMLMPDSILFGSILMYFLTQNISFGIFAIFIFETVLSHKLISWVASQAVGSSRSSDIQCRVGYKTPQLAPQRMFTHDPYPSYGTFSITAIGTYLALATSNFSDTLNAMGQDWPARKTFAYIFIALVISAYIMVRLWKCDTISETAVAFILAIVIGVLFFYINKSLFGDESVNFLGLPYLVSKESQGSPIYVCSAETQDSSTA